MTFYCLCAMHSVCGFHKVDKDVLVKLMFVYVASFQDDS